MPILVLMVLYIRLIMEEVLLQGKNMKPVSWFQVVNSLWHL